MVTLLLYLLAGAVAVRVMEQVWKYVVSKGLIKDSSRNKFVFRAIVVGAVLWSMRDLL